MANPLNTTNLMVSEETYNRLKHIKEVKGWTFNQVVDKLCELELQYNYIEQIMNYELFIDDNIFKFRIIFKKETMIFEYYDGERFTQKISEWGIDKKTQRQFFEFIKEDCARCIFLNMPIGIIFKEFDIYKVE